MRFGSTPYIASRAKSRRKALADRARLRQLINHAPDQLTVAVADLGYRSEIDRYAATYDGGDLIEAALTDNLEHELDNITKLCSGKVARIVAVYTNRFEYHNAKAVLRAVVNDVDLDRVAHEAGALRQLERGERVALRVGNRPELGPQPAKHEEDVAHDRLSGRGGG